MPPDDAGLILIGGNDEQFSAVLVGQAFMRDDSSGLRPARDMKLLEDGADVRPYG